MVHKKNLNNAEKNAGDHQHTTKSNEPTNSMKRTKYELDI